MKLSSHPITVKWYNKGIVATNWGDKLNPALVHLLSDRPVKTWVEPSRAQVLVFRALSKIVGREVRMPRLPWQEPDYLVIGSGLATADSNTIVWGQGFGYAQENIAAKPLKICAVRGPQSREKLRRSGFVCPDAIGDPALLCPLLYRPYVEPSVDFGIIRHIFETDLEVPRLPEKYSTRVIDIAGGLEQVIDEILSCKAILSSSLHGIIAAHAYGVPAGWFTFKQKPRVDHFKFHDYWASVGWEDPPLLEVDAGEENAGLADLATLPKAFPDSRALLEACPFLSPEKEHLVSLCHHVYKRPSKTEALCDSGRLSMNWQSPVFQ